MVEVNIRDVQVSDRKQLNEIRLLIANQGKHSLAPIATDEDLECYSTEEDYEFLVGVDEGRVLGYIEMRFYDGDKMIMELFVHPQFSRKGIGDQLIIELITNVREKKKYSEIYLQVKKANEVIKLYERNGFRKTTRKVTDGYEMVHKIKVPV